MGPMGHLSSSCFLPWTPLNVDCLWLKRFFLRPGADAAWKSTQTTITLGKRVIRACFLYVSLNLITKSMKQVKEFKWEMWKVWQCDSLKTRGRNLSNTDHMGLTSDVFLHSRVLESSLPWLTLLKSVKLLTWVEHEALTLQAEIRLIYEQGQHFGCSVTISDKWAGVRFAAKQGCKKKSVWLKVWSWMVEPSSFVKVQDKIIISACLNIRLQKPLKN